MSATHKCLVIAVDLIVLYLAIVAWCAVLWNSRSED